MGGAPPHFSPDNKWYWDGAKWVPASQAPVPPGAHPPLRGLGDVVRQTPLWVKIGAPALIVVLLVAAFALGDGAGRQAESPTAATSPTAAPTSAATQAPTPAATPLPTPTPTTATPHPTSTPAGPSQAELYAQYTAVNARHANRLVQSMTNASESCGAGDTTACANDFQTALGDVKAWEADLNTTPPPDCLKTMDTHLRQALSLYEQGLTAAIQAINGSDLTKLEEATAHISDANDKMSDATAAAETATCP